MGTVKIDCDDCAVRGPGCQDCVVSVLLGVPQTLLDDERRALEVLAEVGLARQLIELCHGIVCRVGLHMAGDDPSEHR